MELLLKFYKQYIQTYYQYGVPVYCTVKSVPEKIQHQQNLLIRIVFGFSKHKEVRNCRSMKISSVFELHVYDLLKLLSEVIRREHPSEPIKLYITDKEID